MALGLLAVCAAPVVAALLAFFVWPPEGRVNYGELIEATLLPRGALSDLKGKWLLVQADDGSCTAVCQTKLFNMRQARIAQGKDMDRIERVWLLLDDATPSPELARYTDGMRVVRAKGSTLLAQFPAPSDVRDHIYLVDPLGNLVLRYPKDADPRRMIKDLQRLLKVSRIG